MQDKKQLVLYIYYWKFSKFWQNLWPKILCFHIENPICDGISDRKWLVGIWLVEINIVTDPSQFFDRRLRLIQDGRNFRSQSMESFSFWPNVRSKSIFVRHKFSWNAVHMQIGHKRPYEVRIAVTNCDRCKSVRIVSQKTCGFLYLGYHRFII